MQISKSSGEYLEQWERVKRWYKRCSRKEETNFEIIRDNFYAFFQNCYHLADWIQNSVLAEANPEIRDKTYEFAKSKHAPIELGICKNICNGSKHLGEAKTGKKNRHLADVPGVNLPMGREFDPYAKIAGESREFNLFVLAGGNKYDCLKLAKKCLDLWEQFLVNNSLL